MKSFRVCWKTSPQAKCPEVETRGLKLVKLLALLGIAGAHLWLLADGVVQDRTFFQWRRSSWGLGRPETPIERSVSPKAYWASLTFNAIVVVGAGTWSVATIRQMRRM
jgi:hypothetical protein